MATGDPLHELVVDAGGFNRARIVEALRGRLALDEATSRAVVLPGFEDWDSAQKTLSVLLLRKAAVLLDRAEGDGISPADVAEQAGIPAGTVRRVLRELLESHQLSHRDGSQYFLSSAQIGAAIDTLLLNSVETPKPRRRRTKRPTVRRNANEPLSAEGKSAEHGKKAGTKTRRIAGRSPTTLVKELRAAGYLDEAKTVADVQKRLKDKSGHQIPVTTLAPIFTRLLRAGDVDRELTADGVYAYVRRDEPLVP